MLTRYPTRLLELRASETDGSGVQVLTATHGDPKGKSSRWRAWRALLSCTPRAQYEHVKKLNQPFSIC